MKEFKMDLKPKSAAKIYLIKFYMSVFFMVIIFSVIFMTSIEFYKYGRLFRIDDISSFISYVIMFIIFAFIFSRSFKKQIENLKKNRYIVDEDKIGFKKSDELIKTLLFSEISKIEKNKKGTIIIKGKDDSQRIGIPWYIEDFNEFEEILKAKTNIPFTPIKNNTFSILLLLLSVIFILTIMFIIYTSENIIILSICSILFLAFIIYSAIATYKNKYLDKKLKTVKLLFFIIIVAASVIGTAIYKIIKLY